MTSEIDIVNSSLVMLGQRPITSLSDGSDTSLAAASVYSSARDGLLREFPWNFARNQLALNQLATAPIALELLPNNHGPGRIIYTIAFAAPSDILRLFRWAPEYTHWRLVNGVPFGFNGLAIITDAVPAPNTQALNGVQPLNADGADDQPFSAVFIPPLAQVGCEYIARITDPNLMDSLFIDTLIAKVARDLAFMITGLESVQDRAAKAYDEAKMAASAVNGMENWADQLYDNSVADVRYGYSGFWSGN